MKIIIFLIIGGLILPVLSFAPYRTCSGAGFAQQGAVSPPENLEEAKVLGEKAVQITEKELPGNLENIWDNEVLPAWQRMYGWFLANIWSKIDNWLSDVFKPLLKEEAEKRKPLIEEEFQKEKQELKQEAPQVGRTLWERFRELIK